ncbi:acyl-CoA synthetase FdrA [Gudongella sp. DL1XJH-153]|uniref:acyl-CoA synthetase FdrA n=1 Tax=Gudongella sp. DL1XJH-153 TaxID=3409804 RepID=UPI003BB7A022
MILGLVKKNTYQDSVNLMLLSTRLTEKEGVRKVSIMMGTPANKDIFRNTGMYCSEFETANPNDICISVDTDSSEKLSTISEELDAFISDLSSSSSESKLRKAKSLKGALNKIENPNLAIISIPGEYVYEEGKRLLENGMNLFVFSDNVNYEEEKKLKEIAREKGLIVMGPDCGTGIILGVPLAFANVVSRGSIGVVGASGTGIQEITSIIGRLGEGVSHAIGLGGRDLSEEIGGISAEIALNFLKEDIDTEVIVFVSKPPARDVRDKIVEKLKQINKTTVAVFLGEKSLSQDENIHYVSTLEDAANLAFYLSRSKRVNKETFMVIKDRLDTLRLNPKQNRIHGYYGGGTLAGEAKEILAKYISSEGNKIIDYGDDQYTKGRPHPMIDPSTRIEAIKKLKDDESVAIVLFDNVIGHGSSTDMAGALGPHIKDVLEYKRSRNQDIVFIASVCGTEEDIQIYSKQVKELEKSGVVVLDTNAQVAKLGLEAMEYINERRTVEKSQSGLFDSELRVVNIGLESFANTLYEQNLSVVQYNWTPVAGGNKELQKMLRKLENL